MEVIAKHAYPRSAETVFKCFGDKEGTVRRFTALGARNIEIDTLKLTKTSMDMLIHREEPIDAPAFLKKFVGEWNSITQEEHWTGSAAKGYQGELKIQLKGVPVSITGKLTLHGDSESCVNEIVMTFESSIPLIGKKLAAFVAAAAEVQMQTEYELIRDSL